MGRYMLIDRDIRILEEKLQSIRGTISNEEYNRILKRIEEIKNQGIELPDDASMLQANEIITQIVDLEFNNFSKEFMDEATKKSKKEAFLQKLQYITSRIEKNEEIKEVIEVAEAYWNSIEGYYEDIEQRSVREKIDEIKLQATLHSIKRSGKLDIQDISLNQNYFLIRKRLQELVSNPDISEEDKLLINSWLGESVDIKSGEIDTKAMGQIIKTPKLWGLLSGVEEGLQAIGQEYKSEIEEIIEEESEERKKEITEVCVKYGISEEQVRETLENSGDNVYIVQTLFGHKIVLEQDRIIQLKKSRRRDCKKNKDVRAIVYNNVAELIEQQMGYNYIDPEVVIFSDNTVSIGESTFCI